MAKQQKGESNSGNKDRKSSIGKNIQNRGQVIPKPSSELNINPKKNK